MQILGKKNIVAVMVAAMPKIVLSAGCVSVPAVPSPEYSNVFAYQIQTYNAAKVACRPKGDVRFMDLETIGGWSATKCTEEKVLSDRADGCSAGVARDKKIFRTACNEHDKCYASPTDKGACDAMFYRNMKLICARLGNPAGCSISAEAFYDGVKYSTQAGQGYSWGQQYFRNTCFIP